LGDLQEKRFHDLFGHSGVARVPCALGQEIFLRPPLTKTTEFKTKNRCKKCERSKSRTFYCIYFSSL